MAAPTVPDLHFGRKRKNAGGEPPFGSLPDVPFAPVHLADAAPPAPTLAARWQNQSPRRQKVLLAAGVLAVAAAVLAYPVRQVIVPQFRRPAAEAPAPVIPPARTAPKIEIKAPPLPSPPPVALFTYAKAKADVPPNTLLTKETLDQFFEKVEVKEAIPEAAAFNADLRGKFVIKPVDRGQTLLTAYLGDKPLTAETPKPPEVVVAAPKPEPVAPKPPPPPRTQEKNFIDGLGRSVVTYEEQRDGTWKVVQEQYIPNANTAGGRR